MSHWNCHIISCFTEPCSLLKLSLKQIGVYFLSKPITITAIPMLLCTFVSRFFKKLFAWYVCFFVGALSNDVFYYGFNNRKTQIWNFRLQASSLVWPWPPPSLAPELSSHSQSFSLQWGPLYDYPIVRANLLDWLTQLYTWVCPQSTLNDGKKTHCQKRSGKCKLQTISSTLEI